MSHPNDVGDCKPADTDTVVYETRPVIWGGRFDATCLINFLKTWDLAQRDMPWRLWEWISDISMDHVKRGNAGLPVDPQFLERGRIFGADGDLSLRRDGDQILWNFVGRRGTALSGNFHWEEPAKDTPPEKDIEAFFTVADYWTYHPQVVLEGRQREVLLWGEERIHNENPVGTWHDDRVSNVKHPLVYPEMSGKDRVRLSYCEYSRGDVIEAVWWLRLEGWEVNNG